MSKIVPAYVELSIKRGNEPDPDHSGHFKFDAARVDECFSKSNEDLRKIYGMDSPSGMPYIDHLRQEVMFFYPDQQTIP